MSLKFESCIVSAGGGRDSNIEFGYGGKTDFWAFRSSCLLMIMES